MSRYKRLIYIYKTLNIHKFGACTRHIHFTYYIKIFIVADYTKIKQIKAKQTLQNTFISPCQEDEYLPPEHQTGS